MWRRLKRLGVAQLLDGLVALPLDPRNKEQLEWVAEHAIEAGGMAMVWIGRPESRADEATLVGSMRSAIADEYRSLIDEVQAERARDFVTSRRTIMRLRREHHRIHQRDHFPPPEAEQARRAIDDLHQIVEQAT